MLETNLKIIGTVHSCFKEKSGVPRQAGMLQEAKGWIELDPQVPHWEQATRGLAGFSHLWVIFIFHKHGSRNWKPTVRPPRLNSEKKVGVLATRSPHRPNPIGLSVVKLEQIVCSLKGVQKQIHIEVSGLDILDGSPVIDIKPYIPYCDLISTASSGWVGEPIPRYPVAFTNLAQTKLAEFSEKHPNLKDLIHEMMELDPRPAFQRKKLPIGSKNSERTRHAVALLEYDIKWEITAEGILVYDLERLSEHNRGKKLMDYIPEIVDNSGI